MYFRYIAMLMAHRSLPRVRRIYTSPQLTFS